VNENMKKKYQDDLLFVVNYFFIHPIEECVEVLRSVTTKQQQQQQQQPLETGRQIIFQKGVAWTNERATESESILCM